MFRQIKSYFIRLIISIVSLTFDDILSFRKKNIIRKLNSINGFKISENFHFEEGARFDVNYENNTLLILDNVNARNQLSLLVFSGAKLVIGENVFFNNNCSINVLEEVEIGTNTIFGENVKIYDHNHEHYFSNQERVIETNKFSKAKVVIGKNCWIGSNVTILKGVTIGDNVIIGAGCLIYKSITSNSLVTLKQELNIYK